MKALNKITELLQQNPTQNSHSNSNINSNCNPAEWFNLILQLVMEAPTLTPLNIMQSLLRSLSLTYQGIYNNNSHTMD